MVTSYRILQGITTQRTTIDGSENTLLYMQVYFKNPKEEEDLTITWD
jgi:hypothetical protein